MRAPRTYRAFLSVAVFGIVAGIISALALVATIPFAVADQISWHRVLQAGIAVIVSAVVSFLGAAGCVIIDKEKSP